MKSLIEWEMRQDGCERGFLRGHQETSLFILKPAKKGKVHFCGAFIPDEDDGEIMESWLAKRTADLLIQKWARTIAIDLIKAVLD